MAVRPDIGKTDDPRIRVDLAHLRGLEGEGSKLRLTPRQPVRSVLNGRHATKLRGRGLSFEELRGYLPGDDVRAIDWKVTARTGSPHIRVYSEERDRPALLVVDQRMSMFFGTVHAMKSVVAAEAAALVAFGILKGGDRVGGIVFGDGIVAELRPRRQRQAVTRLLTALDAAQAQLGAEQPDAAPDLLETVLISAARLAPRDHLVLILSDFHDVTPACEVLLGGLSRHNDVLLGLVTDPAAQAGLKGDMVVTDGRQQAAIAGSDARIRERVTAAAQARVSDIMAMAARCRTPVLPLTSAEDALPQIRRLLGHAR